MDAVALEESLLYAIPITVFEKYIFEHAEVSKFLLESFASSTRNPYNVENKGRLASENDKYGEDEDMLQYFKPLKHTENPVTATRKSTIKEIAEIMVKYKIGSIIIEENKMPIGIITDKDLRYKVTTGIFSIYDAVDCIMSEPVIPVSANRSVAEVQLQMMQLNIGYLCVSYDGVNGNQFNCFVLMLCSAAFWIRVSA